MGWVVNATPWPLLPPGQRPGTYCTCTDRYTDATASSLLPNPGTSEMCHCTWCHHRRWKFPTPSLWVPKISHCSNSAKNCSEVHVVDNTDRLPGDRIAWNTILVCRMPSEQRPSAEISSNAVRMPQPLHILVQVTCVVWSQGDMLAGGVLTPSAAREPNSDEKYSYVSYTLISNNPLLALNELVQPSIIWVELLFTTSRREPNRNT